MVSGVGHALLRLELGFELTIVCSVSFEESGWGEGESDLVVTLLEDVDVLKLA